MSAGERGGRAGESKAAETEPRGGGAAGPDAEHTAAGGGQSAAGSGEGRKVRQRVCTCIQWWASSSYRNTHTIHVASTYMYTCIYVCLSGLWLGGLLYLSLS